MSHSTIAKTGRLPGLHSTFRAMINRALAILGDPELLLFFFLLRFARVWTRLFKGRIYLTPRTLRQGRIARYIEGGKTFYIYKGQTYPHSVALGHAMQHIKDLALTYCKGRGLDVGSNLWPLPGAHAVDNLPDENAYRLDRWADKSLDFVFSSHCLEHLAEWRIALKLWISKIKPGGVLFLYLPHKSMTLWEPGSPWVGDDHVWSPTVEVITPVLRENGVEVIATDPGPDGYFSFHIIGQKNRTHTNPR